MSTRRLALVPLCLVILPSVSVRAQSLWKWQYPYPQGNDLRAVDMSGSTAVAAGILGMIITSTDFGATWSVTPYATGPVEFRGVSIASASVLVAVGAGGVIARSIDAGNSWNTVVSGTTSDLNAVEFVDASNGLAVGAGGVILQSIDGGQSWFPRTSGTTVDLVDVDFTTTTVATAVGGTTILRSIDGGDSWSPQVSPIGLASIDFIDPLTGVAVGGWSAIWTTDGGATWMPRNPILPPFLSFSLTSVAITGQQTAVAVGIAPTDPDYFPFPGGVMMTTSDGGTTWDWHIDPTYLLDVAMTSPNVGLAVGVSGIIRSVPGGGQIGGGQQAFVANAIDFDGSVNGVAAFSRSPVTPFDHGTARLMYTSDAGATWNQTILSYAEVLDVAFAGGTTVYAVGRGPRQFDQGAAVWRSIDAGASWEIVYGTICPPPSCDSTYFDVAQAVGFAGPAYGIAVGSGGNIIEFNMGVGSYVSPPTTENLWGVSVPSSEAAYAVGENGVVVKGALVESTRQWVVQPSGTGAALFGVHFVDDLTGVAVGAGGTIIKTTDGGATWTPRSSGTTGSLTAVTFTGSVGVIAAVNGVLVTTDGGESWASWGPTPCSIDDIDLIDGPVQVVAIGGNDNIISRADWPVAVRSVSPSSLSMWQNRPNPFNPTTTIRFALPSTEYVELVVFDVRGRSVVTLWEGIQTAGEHEIEWDGNDPSGTQVASGVYFCRLRTGKQSVAMKMVLLK